MTLLPKEASKCWEETRPIVTIQNLHVECLSGMAKPSEYRWMSPMGRLCAA
jgi:hypothetical protein